MFLQVLKIGVGISDKDSIFWQGILDKLSASLFLLEEEQVPYDVYGYTYLCTECVYVLIYAYTYVKVMYVTYVDGDALGFH